MSFKNTMTQSIAAGAVLVAFSFGAQANILVNPGFDIPDTGGAPPEYAGAPGWTTFGGVFTIEDFVAGIPASSPDQVLKTFGTAGAFQDFAVTPGDVVSFTVDAMNASFDPMTPGQVAAGNIEWLDAGGANIVTSFGSTIDGTAASDVWNNIGVIGAVAPAGAVFARGLLITGDFAGPGGGAPLFDSAVMTITPGGPVIPVPAAVWLFGSGLLGLVGVARRKAA